MFADHRVVNLFPTPVWAHSLDPKDHETVNRKALDALQSLGAGSASSPWQSEPTLHRMPEFLVLSGFIKQAAQNVLDHLKVEAGAVRIETLWATVVPRGAVPPAAPDIPGEASLCGIYAVAAPEGGDAITFFDARPELRLGGARLTEPGPHTARTATVSVTAGTLLVFPAWLGCAASPEPVDGERVILEFAISLD